MEAFLAHAYNDRDFVIEVAKYLQPSLNVFYFERDQELNQPFPEQINQKLASCDIFIAFLGDEVTGWLRQEISAALNVKKSKIITILLDGKKVLEEFPLLSNYLVINAEQAGLNVGQAAFQVAKQIIIKLETPWQSADDLPLNPHLFDYEKDIIDHFKNKKLIPRQLAQIQAKMKTASESDLQKLKKEKEELLGLQRSIIVKELNGCPTEWPKLVHWTDRRRRNRDDLQEIVGKFRADDAQVIVAALSTYHQPGGECDLCLAKEELCLPEAGPREKLTYPTIQGGELNVAVLVSGGIAPGVNAVIDGITQRHYLYAEKNDHGLTMYGLKNGFHAFESFLKSQKELTRDTGNDTAKIINTSEHTNDGGSILGTSRFEDLLNIETRSNALNQIVQQLINNNIDILYVIGGDGSMKAAHAIWSVADERHRTMGGRRVSVVAIPKSMDNDILWMWQTFGFMSAVEKAREVIEHLATEVKSNPRLCVVQLFGSDSGFVVSHAVLASKTGVCDAALIPEVDFSMAGLAKYLQVRMGDRAVKQGDKIPYGLIVMAETAIPTDVEDYIDSEKIGLSDEEKIAVKNFNDKRKVGERIQGQTDDALRTAGLKIVSRGLLELLTANAGSLAQKRKDNLSDEEDPDPLNQKDSPIQWNKLRVFTNEPRHLLRAIPPSCADIITSQRLGTLAVDNAMAGYTDFMISQWLTEFVLVPLKLVVLGRKKVPQYGIFWKSVIAKTHQPSAL